MAIHQYDGALVCVWRNAPLLRLATGSYGHVSLKLVGPAYRRRDPVYVSWWPSDVLIEEKSVGPVPIKATQGHGLNTYKDDEHRELGENALARLRGLRDGAIGVRATPRPNQRVLNPDDPPDEGDWICAPDTKIFVPGLGPRTPYGLNLGAIETWWRAYSCAPARVWATLDRNCSTVVCKALRAGGATSLVRKPRCLVMRPTVVEGWALALGERCARRNQATGATGATTRKAGPFAMPAPTEVWTAEAWLAKSIGAPRPPRQVSLVADMLRVYKGLRGDTSRGGHTQIALLQCVIDRLHEDVYHAGAGRHPTLDAPLRLTLQCVAAIDYWRTVRGPVSVTPRGATDGWDAALDVFGPLDGSSDEGTGSPGGIRAA